MATQSLQRFEERQNSCNGSLLINTSILCQVISRSEEDSRAADIFIPLCVRTVAHLIVQGLFSRRLKFFEIGHV